MIPQPARGDGEAAWREYAGDLRQTLGQAYKLIEDLEGDVRRMEGLLTASQRRAKSARSTLNQVHRDLEAGDVRKARGRLDSRAAAIERARA